MRLFAEERRTGTLEVLMTAPVTELQVVLGKFLAVQAFYTLVWLSLLPLFGCLWALAIGKPDPGLLVSMYIGIFGLGLLTNALGLLASAATKNQLVAAVLALSGNLLFFLLSVWRVFFVEDMEWQRFLNYISFTYHFDNAYRAGVVDVRYLLYYGSFAFVFVLFTVRLLEARKWR
jgi:ABC-2 type transport system permease protein